MNTSLILLIILFILMFIVGGSRGIKSFFSLLFNFLILLFMIILINSSFNPIKVTIVLSILISVTTLFYINGVNIKTVSSLLSVIIVILLTLAITYNIGIKGNIQGFGNEQSETIAFVSVYIHLNYSEILFCEILIGLLGAIIDVSISISSSVYEIHKNDPDFTKQKLFFYGMNIGKDVLGTMTNALLFAYIGGFMTLTIYFKKMNYTFTSIINAKVFCSEIFQSLSAGIGIILIIPITSLITSEILSLKYLKVK